MKAYEQGIPLLLPLVTTHSAGVRRHAKLPSGGARVSLEKVLPCFFFTISSTLSGFLEWWITTKGWWGYQPIEKIRGEDWGREEDGGGEGGGRGGRREGDSPLTRWYEDEWQVSSACLAVNHGPRLAWRSCAAEKWETEEGGGGWINLPYGKRIWQWESISWHHCMGERYMCD